MWAKDTVLKQKMGIRPKSNDKRPFWLILPFLFGLLLFAAPVLAHGTAIEMTVVNETTLELRALFDTGDPMSEAQITVYAADNPSQAWHKGVADGQGFYAFEVDEMIRGQWAISVRTAGHGEILHFDVTRNGKIELEQTAERPFWQTILLAAGVIAVLGGIAYWYSRPQAAPQT